MVNLQLVIGEPLMTDIALVQPALVRRSLLENLDALGIRETAARVERYAAYRRHDDSLDVSRLVLRQLPIVRLFVALDSLVELLGEYSSVSVISSLRYDTGNVVNQQHERARLCCRGMTVPSGFVNPAR